MKRRRKILAGYLVSAPIPALIVGELRIEYENLSFWLAAIYGLPFLPVAELTGSYPAGAALYWTLVGIPVALWIASHERASA